MRVQDALLRRGSAPVSAPAPPGAAPALPLGKRAGLARFLGGVVGALPRGLPGRRVLLPAQGTPRALGGTAHAALQNATSPHSC